MPKYGPSRLKFPHGQQRKFVESIFEKSGLNAENLSKIARVSSRTIRDWKREKFNIPVKAVYIFCKRFQIQKPVNITQMIKVWRKNKLEISRDGGFAYYHKFGLPGSIESRRRGGYAGIAKLRKLGLATPVRHFRTPKESVELAEFVGIMLGDGSIGKLQISITLNSIVDADYSIFVSNLCNKLFGCYPIIMKKKNCNAVSVYYNGINLVKFLCRIGMVVGNKVKQQVGVPPWILKNVEYKKVCLRGLMDTDGGVFIHKYKVNGKEYSYKKICFTSYSLPLLYFVYNTLKELGFTPKIIDKVVNKKVWLYNTHEVAKYLEFVKSSNQRLNRYIIR